MLHQRGAFAGRGNCQRITPHGQRKEPAILPVQFIHCPGSIKQHRTRGKVYLKHVTDLEGMYYPAIIIPQGDFLLGGWCRESGLEVWFCCNRASVINCR